MISAFRGILVIMTLVLQGAVPSLACEQLRSLNDEQLACYRAEWRSVLDRLSSVRHFNPDTYQQRYECRRVESVQSATDEAHRLAAEWPAIMRPRPFGAVLSHNSQAAPRNLTDALQFDLREVRERGRLAAYLIEDFARFEAHDSEELLQHVRLVTTALKPLAFLGSFWPDLYVLFLEGGRGGTGCGPFSEMFGTWLASQGFPTEHVEVASVHRGRVGRHRVIRFSVGKQVVYLDLTLGQYTNLALPAFITRNTLLAMPEKREDYWLSDFGFAGYLLQHRSGPLPFAERLDGDRPLEEARYFSILSDLEASSRPAEARAYLDAFRSTRGAFRVPRGTRSSSGELGVPL